jgi:3-deoxy-D-arabino-heptulosonate 7-phosphate (DAHP) synthase class II
VAWQLEGFAREEIIRRWARLAGLTSDDLVPVPSLTNFAYLVPRLTRADADPAPGIIKYAMLGLSKPSLLRTAVANGGTSNGWLRSAQYQYQLGATEASQEGEGLRLLGARVGPARFASVVDQSASIVATRLAADAIPLADLLSTGDPETIDRIGSLLQLMETIWAGSRGLSATEHAMLLRNQHRSAHPTFARKFAGPASHDYLTSLALPPSVVGRAADTARSLLADAGPVAGHELIFGDLKPEHVLCRADGELTLIDPAVRYGSPADDLTRLTGRIALDALDAKPVARAAARTVADLLLHQATRRARPTRIGALIALDVLNILSTRSALALAEIDIPGWPVFGSAPRQLEVLLTALAGSRLWRDPARLFDIIIDHDHGEGPVELAQIGTQAFVEDFIGRWSTQPREQVPPWPNNQRVRQVIDFIQTLPPLVTVERIDELGSTLESVCAGSGFLLQGGDCAETFEDNTDEHVTGTVDVLLNMAAALRNRYDLDVTTIGRFAGQYAKPRTSPTDADGMPAYRGDLLNTREPAEAARTVDPLRMIMGYLNSRDVLERVARHLADRPDTVYSSHEALVLEYETALARSAGRPYATSAHFLWVGDRTRQLDGAHVALLREIRNPIGLKLGPSADPAEVVQLCRSLNEDNEPGRLTLTTRLGHDKIGALLPPIIAAVTDARLNVIWQCDPMHGNTIRLGHGYRTRPFDRVAGEVRQFFALHREFGTHPGGLHVEVTGDDVTECAGGSCGITDDDVPKRFTSAMDPRLNRDQAIELADIVAGLLTS